MVDVFDPDPAEARFGDHKPHENPLALPRKRVALCMPEGFPLSGGQEQGR
jgi:hypothetical protein